VAIPPTGVLHVELAGLPEGPPLVMLHGFTQTGRLWGEFGRRLAESRRLVLVDLPGHGGSAEVRADLAATADLVAAAARRHLRTEEPAAAEPAPVDVLGYSLGGRVALHLALAHPGLLRRLVVIGASGGIEDAAARSARRAADDALAAELEATGDLEGFLERWLASPLFAGLRPGAADLRERRRNTAAGLAASLRSAGTGTQEPLWGRLSGVAAPALVMAGAADHRFVALGARLAASLPAGVLALVPGAGHAAHLEQPAVAARMVGGWLGAAGAG